MSTWKIDPSHSEIEFKVRHMVITNVSGNFDKFDATAITPSDSLENAQITFTADINSVNTGAENRDAALKTDDFFNAEKYPKLSFRSTSFTKQSEEAYLLKGDLTIRDKTHPITLNVEYGGTIKDMWGKTRSGFTVTGKLSRKNFDLRWNALLETGAAVVSDEVKINCHVEFVKE